VSDWLLRAAGDDAAGRPVDLDSGEFRLAVKDAVDVAGSVTTAGCRAVAVRARPAAADADCVARLRAAGAVVVAKATLDELCMSTTGVNEHFGTPLNPLDPTRMVGGSSSGSAVAVAVGDADLALGTDTGGSVRIPAACCGVTGLKTTWGRISIRGVWPLAPSLDTVGPLARDVAGIVRAMRVLAPDWSPAPSPARSVGRLRLLDASPVVEDAVDAALDGAGIAVADVDLLGWARSFGAFIDILQREFWSAHGDLLGVEGVGEFAAEALAQGRSVSEERWVAALAARAQWRTEISALLGQMPVLALPTLIDLPPRLDQLDRFDRTGLTAPINLAGLPALAMPIPADGDMPASLQLIAGAGGEELLCATAALIERGRGEVTHRPG
jgi:amidase